VAVISDPVEKQLHNPRLIGIDLIVSMFVTELGSVVIPIERLCREDMPFLYLSDFAKPKAFRDFCPLILGKEASHPVQNFLFAILRCGYGNEHDFNSGLSQLVHHQFLVRISSS